MTRPVRSLLVALTALASLGLTTLAWREAREEAEREERLRFELRVEEIANSLRGRMLDYEQVLRGLVGLFAASRQVERGQWHVYARLLDLQSTYPGIRGIAYAQLSREGPVVRVPVVLVYPEDENNLGLLGFDVYSDPLRRAATDRARDTAEPVVSAPLQLRGYPTDAPRSGFVMYLPVFRTAVDPHSLSARRAGLTGFVFGTFRVREILERTIGTPPGIRLRLVDVTDAASPAVLIEQEVAFGSAVRYERTETIVARGRTWRLEAAAPPGLGAGGASDRPRLVLAGGIAVSLLLTGLVWSLLNTTTHARVLARSMLAANQELDRFRAAVDGSQDTMLMVDVQKMRIEYANEGACRNLGYRREELVGQPPDMVFADRGAERLALEYQRLAGSDERAGVYRAMHRRKDGSVFPVEIAREVVKGADGNLVLGIARDISARLEAERALREGERRLALALESSKLALFDWDLRTGLVHMGAQWGVIVGGKPEPSVTPMQKLEPLVHPDDLPALRERLRRLLKGEISNYRVEHRVRTGRGDWIWIESVAEVSERDAEGRALRVTGTNGDITERKALAELKAAFLASVSHELRTPLTGIVASLALLQEGAAGELPAEARHFVALAHANGERLAALVNDLLDLERVESGRLRLELEDLDAGAMLQEAASLDTAYAERFNARVRVDAEAGLRITADRRRLLQVLSNLISNAAKFSPAGGEVTLRARGVENHRVVLSVSDQGPGIPQDFKARLFGKFEQADPDKPGTGLGLAICKSLVERMGGRIWCESEPGKGATFLAELPRAA